jgi:hypothetical protein
MCHRHDALLTAALRELLHAVVDGAVAHVAAAQMRVAFEALPNDVRNKIRERAKEL